MTDRVLPVHVFAPRVLPVRRDWAGSCCLSSGYYRWSWPLLCACSCAVQGPTPWTGRVALSATSQELPRRICYSEHQFTGRCYDGAESQSTTVRRSDSARFQIRPEYQSGACAAASPRRDEDQQRLRSARSVRRWETPRCGPQGARAHAPAGRTCSCALRRRGVLRTPGGDGVVACPDLTQRPCSARRLRPSRARVPAADC